jgi:hypothetical protein
LPKARIKPRFKQALETTRIIEIEATGAILGASVRVVQNYLYIGDNL